MRLPTLLLPLLQLCLLSVYGGATKDLYAVLSVPRSASDAAIRKAFKALSRKYHPDKTRAAEDAVIYADAKAAYEVLVDPTTRAIYDAHGHQGLERHAQQEQAAQDPFNPFNQRQQNVPRTQAIRAEIQVTLSDIYNGKTFDVTIERNVLCGHCGGSGAHHPDDVKTCTTCHGSGITVVRQQVMPGFFTNVQAHCPTCHGQGRTVERICGRCGGARLERAQKALELHVERGMPEGHQIVFEGESHQSPEIESGDVIFTLRTQPLPGAFSRIGNQLYFSQPLSLAEALLGFEKAIEHMDGRTVRLARKGVTQPGEVETIAGEGMPRWAGQGDGDLYVTYEVVLPSLNAKQRKELAKILKYTAPPSHQDL